MSTDDAEEDEETLSSRVTTLTDEYTAAIATYIYTVERSHHAEKDGEGGGGYDHLAGQTWWGESARESRAGVLTADLCEQICSRDPKCSGATYGVKTKYCWTRQGNGPVTPAEKGEKMVAIVPSSLVALDRIGAINARLAEANEKLRRCVERKLQPSIIGLDASTAQKHAEIARTMAQLASHQADIDRQKAELKRVETYDVDYTTGIFTTLAAWILLLVVALVAIVAVGVPPELVSVLVILALAALLLMRWQ